MRSSTRSRSESEFNILLAVSAISSIFEIFSTTLSLSFGVSDRRIRENTRDSSSEFVPYL
ncbi:MAG TPA: hypothetical protein ENF18_00090 [candidate division WOR-3 bacterium]|uniref:Uncharacterized protein n=1 Tax=candidate division WOR-3 bacterium TaxID=2052148 RepID=A0A7C0V9J2_UNCW3|nr:hypothetical protein [candidate division WOR-3 bacterium]